MLFGGVALGAGAPHIVGLSAFGVETGLLVSLLTTGTLAVAATYLGYRTERHVAKATALASRFAAGETHLRLDATKGFARFRELADVLNTIAAMVEDRDLQFWLLSEATGDLVWDWDLGTDLVTCRRGAAAAIGGPEDTFVYPNSWWLDRVHPEDRAGLLASFHATFGSDARLWSGEYRFRHADGGYRWFWDRGIVVRTAAGRPIRVIGCMTDISTRKAAESMLKVSERRYRSLVTATSSIVWSTQSDGRITSPHPAWQDYTGQSEAEYMGWGWLEAFHPDDRDRVAEAWKESLRTGMAYDASARVCSRDGEYRWVSARGVAVPGADGDTAEWVGLVVDVHDEKQAEIEVVQKSAELAQRLRELDCLHAISVACGQDHLSIAEILDRAAEVLPKALMRPGAGCCEIACNGAVRGCGAGTGAAREPLVVGGTEVGHVALGYGEAAAGQALSRGERDLLATASAMLTQMLSQRAARDRVRHTASHDSLTGLPNRLMLQDALEAAFRDKEAVPAVALLLLDLDHFKDVNDTLGHDAGDALLSALGTRLATLVGENGLVGRLGGDEFAVLLRGSDAAGTTALAQLLLKEVRRPVRFEGRDISIRATIGVAVCPQDADSAAELLKNADIALYFGKATGRNAVAVYRPSMRAMMEQRVTVCAQVRDSLADDVFIPYYQPKVSLTANHIRGFEALLRWNHPTRGLQSAETVMPAFEDNELALALGDRMRHHVFNDMRNWRDMGIDFHRIAINLSSAEFAQAGIADRVLEQLNRAGLIPSDIGVEVTETVLLGREAEAVGLTLARLHEAGVQISLDDFGTGYASLTHLQQYPVDVIKIDKSFVCSILTDTGSQAITSAVVELGRRLGMTVVAEGVETADHAEMLRQAGCDEGQGFYFAKAMPASRVPYILGGSERLSWGTQH